MTTPEVRALCCECGNLRTVSANYRPPRDENRTTDASGEPHGWRMTGTVKCRVCKTRTRHAILRDDDSPENRDFAELREYGLDVDCDELRREVCLLMGDVQPADLTRSELQKLIVFLRPIHARVNG